MITNLSKQEYYRSKNIVVPRQFSRIQPQPPVRTHMLQPLLSYTFQIQRIVESSSALHSVHTALARCHKTISEQEETIHQLTCDTSVLQEQIVAYTRLQHTLTREIASLKQQALVQRQAMEKGSYEHTVEIEHLRQQLQSVSLQYEGRIAEYVVREANAQSDGEYVVREREQGLIRRLEQSEKDNGGRIMLLEAERETLVRAKQQWEVEGRRLIDKMIKIETENMEKENRIMGQSDVVRDKCNKLEHDIERISSEKVVNEKHARSIMEEMGEQIQYYQREIRENNQKHQQYRKIMESKIDNNQRELQGRYKQLLKSKEQINGENSQMRKKIFEMEKKYSANKRQIENLQIQCRDNKHSYESRISQMNRSHKEMIERLQMQLQDEYNNKMKQLSMQLQRSKMQAVHIEQSRHKNELHAAVKSHQHQFAMKSNDFESLKSKYQRLQHQLTDRCQMCTKQQLLLKQYQSELTVLQSQFTSQITNKISQQTKSYHCQVQRVQQQLHYRDEEIVNLTTKANAMLSKLSQCQSTYKSKLSTAASHHQQLLQSLSSTQSQLRDKCHQFLTVQAKYKDLVSERDTLQLSLKKQSLHFSQRLKEADQLRLSLIRKYSQSEQCLTANYRKLQSQHMALTKHLTALQSTLAMHVQTTVHCQQQLSRRDAQLKLQLQSRSVGSKELQSLKLQYQGMKEALVRQFAERETLYNANVQKKEQSIGALQEEIYKINQHLGTRQKHVESVQMQLSECRRVIGGNKSEITNLNSQITALTRDINTLNGQLFRVNNVLAVALSDKQSTINMNSSLLQKYSRLQTEYSSMKDQNIQLSGEVQLLLRSRQQYQCSIKQLRTRLQQQSRCQYHTLLLKYSQVQSQRNTLHSRLSSEQSQLSRLTYNYEQMSLERNTMLGELTAAKALLQQFQREGNSLKLQLNELAKECQFIARSTQERIQSLEGDKLVLGGTINGLGVKLQEQDRCILSLRSEINTKQEEYSAGTIALQESKILLERKLAMGLHAQQQLQNYLSAAQESLKQVREECQVREHQYLEQQGGFTLRLNCIVRQLTEEHNERQRVVEQEKQALKQEVKEGEIRIMEMNNKYVVESSKMNEKYNLLVIRMSSTEKQLMEYKRKWAHIRDEVTVFGTDVGQEEKEVEMYSYAGEKQEKNYFEQETVTKKSACLDHEEPFRKYLNRMTMMGNSKGRTILSESFSSVVKDNQEKERQY